MTFELGLIVAGFIFTWWQAGKEIDKLKLELANLEDRLTQNTNVIDEVITDLKTNFTITTLDIKDELREKISEIDTELEKLPIVETDLKTEISRIDAEINEKVSSIEREFNEKISKAEWELFNLNLKL